MSGVEKILEGMRTAPQNVRFANLFAMCKRFFGNPRQQGTSHAVFKLPWADLPLINIQRGKDGKAKVYQVKQVVAAIERLREEGL